MPEDYKRSVVVAAGTTLPRETDVVATDAVDEEENNATAAGTENITNLWIKASVEIDFHSRRPES